MNDNIGDRMKAYERVSDMELMRRVPILIRCDGRSFTRLCRKLQKPYDPTFSDLMVDTTFYVVSELGGAVFAYQQSDEMTFVLRNDQTNDAHAWYGNRIQKITSVVASLATLGFSKALSKLENKPNLVGDAIFDARVFAVPTIGEAVNNLIWRQKDCIRNAILGASQYFICKKFGKKTGLKMLHKQTTKSKVALIQDECGVDLEKEFPPNYRLGVGVYKVPMIISAKEDDIVTRNKWIIDRNLPLFLENKEFIYNIISNGRDIFREENLTPPT